MRPDAGPGIETLVVLLGSNNALQTVTKLKVAWSGAGYDDIAKKGAFTVWRPEHFSAEWAPARRRTPPDQGQARDRREPSRR